MQGRCHVERCWIRQRHGQLFQKTIPKIFWWAATTTTRNPKPYRTDPPIWACDTAGGFTPGKNLSWWSYVKFYAEGESGTIREYCGILKVIYCLRPITWYHIAKQRSHQVVCHVFLGGNSLVMPSSTSGPHCACERRVLGWVGIEITDSRKSRTLE